MVVVVLIDFLCGKRQLSTTSLLPVQAVVLCPFDEKKESKASRQLILIKADLF